MIGIQIKNREPVVRLLLALVALIAPISLPAVAQDRVAFASPDADPADGRATTIVAWLYRPQGNGPFPAVVGMHGCGGLLVHFRRPHTPVIETMFDDWARHLQAAGYVVLLPDSYGPRGINEICSVKDREAVSRARPRDAYAALGWLQAQPYVAPERIALIGWSHGGGTVMRSVEASSEARPSVLPHGGFRAAVAFYPGCPNVRTREGRAASAGSDRRGRRLDFARRVPQLCRGRRQARRRRDAAHVPWRLPRVRFTQAGRPGAHRLGYGAGRNRARRPEP